MSGGYFEYKQYVFEEISDRISRYLAGHPDEPEDIQQNFLDAIKVLDKAQIYAQRIDWYLSGDDGENSFRRRLAEELEGIQ